MLDWKWRLIVPAGVALGAAWLIQIADWQRHRALTVNDDLRLTVWAESPHVRNPTSIDVDYRGRVWVAQSLGYRPGVNGCDECETAAGGAIVILEDTDGNGTCDSSKTFIDDPELKSPLGVAVLGNEVVVSCSPNVICYQIDESGDKPAGKRILLSGFGGEDHDHGVHAVVAGPDGRWYLTVGDEGPHTIRGADGKVVYAGNYRTGFPPDPRSGNRIWPGGLTLSVNPDGSDLRVEAYNFRNSYDLAIDSFGNIWQSDNDDDGNGSCRIGRVIRGGNYGFYSASGRASWRVDQRPGQAVVDAHWHADDPGVCRLSRITGSGGPAGIVAYEGRNLPERYQGSILAADAGRGTVTAYLPRFQGADVELRPFPVLWETTGSGSSARRRFRPSDVAVAPDGAVYVADWYDSTIGGHRTLDEARWGRILRITNKRRNKNDSALPRPRGGDWMTAITNPAINVRFGARQAFRNELTNALSSSLFRTVLGDPIHRARAIGIMGDSPGIAEALVVENLASELALVRLAAFRALAGNKESTVFYSQRMLGDASALVRAEVALALGRVPKHSDATISQLISLASSHQAGDRTYLEALNMATQGHRSILFRKMLAQPNFPPSLGWSPEFTEVVWSLSAEDSCPMLLERAMGDSLPLETRVQALETIAFIPAPAATEALEYLVKNLENPALRRLAKWWTDARKGKRTPPLTMMDGSHPAQDANVDSARREGDNLSERRYLDGKKLFFSDAKACSRCHVWNGKGGHVGPDLSNIGEKYDRTALIDAILYPNAAVAPEYAAWDIELENGDVLSGLILADGETLQFVMSDGSVRAIAREQIAKRTRNTTSLMPANYRELLSDVELTSICDFLMRRKTHW